MLKNLFASFFSKCLLHWFDILISWNKWSHPHFMWPFSQHFYFIPCSTVWSLMKSQSALVHQIAPFESGTLQVCKIKHIIMNSVWKLPFVFKTNIFRADRKQLIVIDSHKSTLKNFEKLCNMINSPLFLLSHIYWASHSYKGQQIKLNYYLLEFRPVRILILITFSQHFSILFY